MMLINVLRYYGEWVFLSWYDILLGFDCFFEVFILLNEDDVWCMVYSWLVKLFNVVVGLEKF